MRRAPTTGTVMVVAQATTTRNAISVRWGRSPRASAISGTMEVSISRRYRTPMARTHTSPRTATGKISLVLTPRISPKSSEKISGSYSVLWLRNAAPRASIITRASAVTTSGRPRRPRDPMPRAARSENTPRPTSGLMPMRLAPAAPAKAPLGMAWAGKAAPRSTTKKPTTPATTATMVATSQALTMKPENISAAPTRSRPCRWAAPHRRGPARRLARADRRDRRR